VRRAAPVLAVIGLISAVSSGCQILQPAAQSCAKEAAVYDSIVVGAFDTSVGAARAIERMSVAPDRWPGVPDSYPAAVCYLDGHFPKSPPGGDPFDRAIVVVVNGTGELIVMSYRTQLPVQAPEGAGAR
jgi:hypothetical protein